MSPPPGAGGPGGSGSGDNTPKILSIASLVTGVIGLCSCMCFIGAIAAIVLGILGKQSADKVGDDSARTMALIGLALGAVGLLAGIGYWIWALVSAADSTLMY